MDRQSKNPPGQQQLPVRSSYQIQLSKESSQNPGMGQPLHDNGAAPRAVPHTRRDAPTRQFNTGNATTFQAGEERSPQEEGFDSVDWNTGEAHNGPVQSNQPWPPPPQAGMFPAGHPASPATAADPQECQQFQPLPTPTHGANFRSVWSQRQNEGGQADNVTTPKAAAPATIPSYGAVPPITAFPGVSAEMFGTANSTANTTINVSNLAADTAPAGIFLTGNGQGTAAATVPATDSGRDRHPAATVSSVDSGRNGARMGRGNFTPWAEIHARVTGRASGQESGTEETSIWEVGPRPRPELLVRQPQVLPSRGRKYLAESRGNTETRDGGTGNG